MPPLWSSRSNFSQIAGSTLHSQLQTGIKPPVVQVEKRKIEIVQFGYVPDDAKPNLLAREDYRLRELKQRPWVDGRAYFLVA